MALIVVPFSVREHLDETVEVLSRIRRSDPAYPPRQDADSDPRSLATWLMQGAGLGRWVGLFDGRVAGHVLVSAPHGYLLDHFGRTNYAFMAPNGIGEIGKFFVDPQSQRGGIGSALFSTAVEFAWNAGLQPALAVLTASEKARRFYTTMGMNNAGSFLGVHGENHVFIDETAARRAPQAATQ